MPRLLTINDVAWLYAESARTPMQVGMLATFTLPEDADEGYLAGLVERWRGVRSFSPPFNYVFRGLLPHWETVDDADIDLDHHLHHTVLPAPGGEAALTTLVARLHGRRMDRRRPLWEVHVVGGVGPREWALYLKLHHSQVDGVGGLRMAKRFLSVDPSVRGMAPPWAVGTDGVDQSGTTPAVRPAPAAGTGSRTRLQGLRSVAGSLTRTYAETLGAVPSRSRDPLRALPYHAPRTALNGRIGPARRFATQSWEMHRLRAVAAAAGASINDVYLAAVGGGLRRHLLELGGLPERSLTASIPVAVRAEDPTRVGNALTFLWSELGTDLADPVARLAAVRKSTLLGKQRVPTASRAVMDAYTVLLMLPVLGQAVTRTGGVGPPPFNVVVSNVTGFTEQRWLDGSPVQRFWPLSLLFHGQGLNITAISNESWFCVGYTAAADAVPHPDGVAAHSGSALEELEAAYGSRGGFRRAAGLAPEVRSAV